MDLISFHVEGAMQSKVWVILVTGLATMFSLAPVPLWGQAVSSASITGVVIDPAGAVVPGAKVEVTQVNTGMVRTTVSAADGSYSFPNLPVGPYKLEVMASGFQAYEQTGIVLQVANHVTINVTLRLGSLSQQVQVQANASMVQTQNAAVSNVVDQQRVVDLPLNGRQATQLILISGASTMAPGGDLRGSKNFYSSTTISVAGGQANGTNYLLDGGDYNDTMTNVNLPFPFPDAIQEFSVDTSALPAQYGLHPGGTVNVVTKSGTNQFHGDAFEFVRNGAVDARNFFAANSDTLRQNQFGGTIGGPIKHDKLFFFFGYQGTRVRSTPPQTISHVPTEATLNGDFSVMDSPQCRSKGALQLNDPFAGGPAFTNNQIPTSMFSQAALNLVKYLPQTSDPCGEVVYGIPGPSNEYQMVGRTDFVKSAKQSLFGRYLIDNYVTPAPWDPHNLLVTVNPGNDERVQAFTLGDTYSLSATTLNSFHASFNRRRDNRGPNPNQINVNKLGVDMFTYVPDDIRLSVTGYFNIGCGTCAPGFFNVNEWQLADDVDLMRSKHQISFGVDFIRAQNNTLSGYLQNGDFTFGGLGTGDGLADFLLGYLSSSSTAFSQSRSQQVALRESIPGLYVQDIYHASRAVTINAGLRWEPMLFPQDNYGRGSSFNLAAFLANQKSRVFQNAPAGMFYYGDPGIPKAFTHDTLANFAPRLGIAWSPGGKGNQTFRVGGGIFYDSGMMWFPQRLMSNPPYVNEIDLTTDQTGSFDSPWSKYPGGNPFPGVFPPPANAPFPSGAYYAVLPLHLHPTYLASWDASYERQFAGNWMVSATYMGNKTTHLWLTQDLNPETNGKSSSRVLNLLNPVQGPAFGQLDLADDGANANYNALLVTLRHRISHGFTLFANYTYSRCLSDGDFNGDLRGSYYQDPFNRALDYGNCNFDLRHIFNGTVVATSPVRGSGFASHLLGNWRLAPLVSITSGTPFNITTGKNNSLTGEGLDRPNLVPGVTIFTSGPCASKVNCVNYLDPVAFETNLSGTFGTLARDAFYGPGSVHFDVALSRLFKLTERFNLEARFEAFNVINYANFNNPTTGMTSSNFGLITGAGDPRILQFALKLHF
jgi:hypothetical protein